MTTRTEIQTQAKILQNFLKNNNQDIKLTSCFQAIAKMNGYKDWNIMSAELDIQAKTKAINETGFISNHIQIAETALLSITNKGKVGKLDEDAIRLLLFLLFKLEKNSTLFNENQISFLLKPDRFHRALNLLIEENFIIRTNYEEYYVYEINPNYFWKGDNANHKEAVNNLCKNTIISEAEKYMNANEQSDLPDLHSFFESSIKEKEIEFSKEIFNSHNSA